MIDVVVWTQQGMIPEQIADEYRLTLAEIHAALAYYYDHKAALDAQFATDEARLAEYAANDHSPVKERLRALS